MKKCLKSIMKSPLASGVLMNVAAAALGALAARIATDLYDGIRSRNPPSGAPSPSPSEKR